MDTFVSSSDALRAEIWRALSAKFGSVAPVPASDAYELLRGHKIGPAAMTHRRQRDALPWPRSAELRDGARRLVPLIALVDCLAGVPVDASRPRRGRGRPRKVLAGGLEGGEV